MSNSSSPEPPEDEVVCAMMRSEILNSLCPNHVDGFRSFHNNWGTFCLRYSNAEPSEKLFLVENFYPQVTIANWDKFNLWVLGGGGCTTFRDICHDWGFRALAYIRLCHRCRNFARPLPGMPHENWVSHGCDSGYFQTEDGELAYYGSRFTNLPNQDAVERRFVEEESFTCLVPTEGVERSGPSLGRRRGQRARNTVPVRRSPRFPRRSPRFSAP